VSLGLDIADEMRMDPDLFLNVYGKWKVTFSGPAQMRQVKAILFAFAAHFSDDSVADGRCVPSARAKGVRKRGFDDDL
jgi:hypothetical protein